MTQFKRTNDIEGFEALDLSHAELVERQNRSPHNGNETSLSAREPQPKPAENPHTSRKHVTGRHLDVH